ncbi:MAG: hypothetical protein LAT53_11985 [Idiomarina sp.]|nr:hypothetical protein [Idiomarina sp.]
MIGINTPTVRVKKLIADKKQKLSIDHIKNGKGETASWKDDVWVFNYRNSKSINLYFVKKFPIGGNQSSASGCEPLPSPMKQLLMIYSLDMLNKRTSVSNVKSKISRARFVLEAVDSIESITDGLLEKLSVGKSYSYRVALNTFIKWLNEKNIFDSGLSTVKTEQPSLTGDEIDFANQDKLPDEKVLIALGAIHHDVIPTDEEMWCTKPNYPQKDPYICTMVALALAAPNRSGAEQTILDSQLLKTIITDKLDVNGNRKVVHYLDWKGSKGFKNSENHILANMVVAVERSLRYIKRATAPMRILSRFYVNPKLSLEKLLLNHSVSAQRLLSSNSSLNKATNILKLAYLLELFDDGHCVQVPRHTRGSYQHNTNTFNSKWLKPAQEIETKDKLIITKESLVFLLNIETAKTTNNIYHKLNLSREVSVEEFQNAWIKLVKETHPMFPKLTHTGNNGTCDARYMMFAFSGWQLGIRAGSVSTGLNTKLMPVSPQTLTYIFSKALKCERDDSIFLRHGFSESFEIRPHQFRHFLNHNADESGLPKLITNIWSKRKDPTQIIHYVHTGGADKARIISDIVVENREQVLEEAAKDIKVISMQEYEKLTGEVASETSSGICTQSLSVNPCNYLNDFETQCVLCESSCHIAHDKEAIKVLQRDLDIQNSRLEVVFSHPRFKASHAMQKWFELHSSNKAAIEQLISLMIKPDIEKGSLIRVLSNKLEFRITNIKTKEVIKYKLQLPDTKSKVEALIGESESDQIVDSITDELLGLI